MKNISDFSHKAVWGIAFAYAAGMFVFAMFTWLNTFWMNGNATVQPIYSQASTTPKYIGPPVCEPSIGDARCDTDLKQYGMVDSVSANVVSGWLYKQDMLSTDARVLVTFTGLTNTKVQYAETVALTQDRADIAKYLKTQFPNLNIVQPLGFLLNPSLVIKTPGTYKISAVEQSSGLALDISSPLSVVTVAAR